MKDNMRQPVPWYIFAWAMAFIVIVIGWTFTRTNSLEARVEIFSAEATQIQVQLAAIKADLEWIKLKFR